MSRGQGSRSVRWLKLPGEIVVSDARTGRQGQVISALEASLVAWGLGKRISVRSGGRIRESEDGVCAVILADTERESAVPVDHREHAFTRLYTRSVKNTPNDEIVEADITISPYLPAEGNRSGEGVLRALLLHEVGHFLGLDHPCAETDALTRDPRGRPRCVELSSKERAMLPDPLAAKPLRFTPARAELQQVELLYGSHGEVP